MKELTIGLLILAAVFTTMMYFTADEDECYLDAISGYGQDSVQKLGKYSYLVYEDGKFMYVIKGKQFSTANSKEINVTGFIAKIDKGEKK